MISRFWKSISDPYVAEIFGDLQRKSLKQAVFARTGIAVLFSLIVLINCPSTAGFFYYLALFSLLIGLGLAQYLLGNSPYMRHWHPYLFALLDCLVVSLALFWEPGAAATPQGLLSNQVVLYYLLVIILSGLSYSPHLLLWTSIINALAWLLGFSLVANSESLPVADSNNTFGLLLSLQVFSLFLVGGILTLVIWQLRRSMFEQIMAEREFYDIMLAERAQRPDEDDGETPINYTDELTGLGNRDAFKRDSALFTHVFAEGRLTDLTIAFIDLEGHEQFLEKYGQEAYENMLQAFANSARQHFRSSDMTYRFSDTQFALLAPGASMRNASRLRSLLAEIVAQVHQQGFSEVDASMGLSTLHEAQQVSEAH